MVQDIPQRILRSGCYSVLKMRLQSVLKITSDSRLAFSKVVFSLATTWFSKQEIISKDFRL